MNDGSGFQKRRQVLEMLDAGLVMLHLDPRPPEVIVPERFKADPVLRLNLAYQFRLPALDIGVEGVYAVLSFDKQNYGCTLPWSAIFAVTCPNAGHDGVVWPESVPPELRSSFQRAGVVEPTRLQSVPPPAPRPTGGVALAAVPDLAASDAHDGGAGAGTSAPSDGSTTAEAAAEPAPPTRRRAHLTLVKG